MTESAKKLLLDIREAADRITRFLEGRSREEYLADLLLQAAVERYFIAIGEALIRLRREESGVSSRISDVPQIIHFRNFLVHVYDAVDPEKVWQAVESGLPTLRVEVQGLLDSAE